MGTRSALPLGYVDSGHRLARGASFGCGSGPLRAFARCRPFPTPISSDGQQGVRADRCNLRLKSGAIARSRPECRFERRSLRREYRPSGRVVTLPVVLTRVSFSRHRQPCPRRSVRSRRDPTRSGRQGRAIESFSITRRPRVDAQESVRFPADTQRGSQPCASVPSMEPTDG